MDTKLSWAIAALVLIAAAVAAYYLFLPAPAAAPGESAPLYRAEIQVEEKPDVRPTAKTNPYSDVKTNPFE